MNNMQNILSALQSHPTPLHDDWPVPKLSLELQELDHAGVIIFLTCLKPLEDMTSSVISVLQQLYSSPKSPSFPSGSHDVKHVKLIVRPLDGVAYTTGVGDGRKEIHLSADYVHKVSKNKPTPTSHPDDPTRYEILGVLVHELVHCFQYNAQGTCPGGLIEGIADFVRLQAKLGAKHWKRPAPSAPSFPSPSISSTLSMPVPTPFPNPVPGNTAPIPPDQNWDSGYERTAFFLEWIEDRYGKGTIQELNSWMRDRSWDEQVFKDLTGRKVKKLWKIYCDEMSGAPKIAKDY